MVEEWRTVVEDARYEVSNFGRVRSLPRLNVEGSRLVRRKGVDLTPFLGNHGYWVVQLGKKSGPRLVHILVAAAFIGPCPEGQEVRHGDDNRQNARLDNLCYGTRKQNVADMISRGRHGDRRAAHAKGRETRFAKYGLDAEKVSAAKTVATRNERYGPGHTRLGFAGIKYSREFDL